MEKHDQWWSSMAKYDSDNKQPSFDGNTSVDTTKLSDAVDDLSFSDSRQKIDNAGNVKTDVTPLTGIDANLVDKYGQGIIDSGRKLTKEDISDAGSLRTGNNYDAQIKKGVGMLEDYASGDSQVDRTISNRLLSRYDASSAAANLSQGHRIASNANLTEGAKQTAIAELNRNLGMDRSNLVGELAQQAQERAYGAAKDFTTLALEAGKFTEEKFRTDVGIVTDQLNRELNAGIAVSGLAATELTAKVNIATEAIRAFQNDARMHLEAAVASGNLEKDEAALRMTGLNNLAQIEVSNLQLGLEQNRQLIEWINNKETNAIRREELEARMKSLRLEADRLRKDMKESTGAALSSFVLNLRSENKDISNAELMDNPLVKSQMMNYYKYDTGLSWDDLSEDRQNDWAEKTLGMIRSDSVLAKEDLKNTWLDMYPNMSDDDFETVYKNTQEIKHNVRRDDTTGVMTIVSPDGTPLYNLTTGEYIKRPDSGEAPTTYGLQEDGTTVDLDSDKLWDSFTDSSIFESWASKNNVTSELMTEFKASLPDNGKYPTHEDFKTWYDSEGKKLNPPEFTKFAVSGAGLSDIRNFYNNNTFKDFTKEDYNKLTETHSEYLHVPPKNLSKDDWNANLGKIIMMDGTPYVVYGTKNVDWVSSGLKTMYVVYDPITKKIENYTALKNKKEIQK